MNSGSTRGGSWWRRDVRPHYVMATCLGVALAGCIAFQSDQSKDADRARRKAVEGVMAIQVPDSMGQSPATSRGCHDFQPPSATRSAQSSLPTDSVLEQLIGQLQQAGWSHEHTPAGEDRLTRADLTLWILNTRGTPDGTSHLTLTMDATASCW